MVMAQFNILRELYDRLFEDMNERLQQISTMARQSAQRNDWATVHRCADEILKHDAESAEGFFLMGLVEKAAQHPLKAVEAFEKVLELDAERYDAAIELSSQYVTSLRYEEATRLIARYKSYLNNSPRYLDMAATNYTSMSLSAEAWPLYKKANELQPNIGLFQANLAACAVFLGKIEEAREIYESLLKQNPNHQRNHYQYSRLETATDSGHIDQMKRVLDASKQQPSQNIFMYYALGKELEDLLRWDEAFDYYKSAGDAVTSVSNYNIETDTGLIEKIIDTCTRQWMSTDPNSKPTEVTGKSPVFILGLPRTGTTLTERILSSHSKVSSIGETQFVEVVLRRESGVESIEKMNLDMIEAVAKKDIWLVANGYLNMVDYMLEDTPMFIDKLPYNFLYIGFIAKAFPDARIICLRRNPMDTCFSMYKQAFTWAYKFSYSLSDLGTYYIAYSRLFDHWKAVLGERLIEINYESLVTDQEQQTRGLLNKVGLDFEEACINFDENTAASMTASSVQVREKVHSRSVERWREFETQLAPLRTQLDAAGIRVD